MKYLTILICASILSGCAVAVPMEELQAQALLSGDWSEVEKRERRIARRNSRENAACPRGGTALCVMRGAEMICDCVSQTAIRDLLSSRPR